MAADKPLSLSVIGLLARRVPYRRIRARDSSPAFRRGAPHPLWIMPAGDGPVNPSLSTSAEFLAVADSHDPFPRPLHTSTLRWRGASARRKHHAARCAGPVDTPGTLPGSFGSYRMRHPTASPPTRQGGTDGRSARSPRMDRSTSHPTSSATRPPSCARPAANPVTGPAPWCQRAPGPRGEGRMTALKPSELLGIGELRRW
jgi:hypothetical protein